MTLDEIIQANELWSQHKDAINQIAKIDLSITDFVQARIWTRLSDIEQAARTELVKLTFLDPYKHEFADKGHIELKFGTLVRTGDAFEIPALPILIELDVTSFQDLSVSIQLQIPEEKSRYRTQFIAALLPLKQQIREEPDSWDWKATLGELELQAKADDFDLDTLADQLPKALQAHHEAHSRAPSHCLTATRPRHRLSTLHGLYSLFAFTA
nr:hypothetical protein [uncultured Cohaesibacter sp.]